MAPERGAARRRFPIAMRCLVLALVLVLPSACGVAAFPCRVSGAAVDMVPVVGHPVAAPFDACANSIDPGG